MRRILTWLAAASLTLAAASPGLGQRISGDGAPIEASYFGMHIHHTVRPSHFRRQTPWPEVQFGTWRLVDAYVKWRDLEPKRGQWNFELLDQYAELAQKHGVSLLYTFGHPAQWASARPEEPSYTYGPGVAAEPADMADWENYVRTIVTRYRGRIQAYEIWNEPWFKEVENVINKEGKAGFYSGSAQTMIELARVAHRIIKEVDPAAKVLTPGFDNPETGPRRLDLYLKLGGAAMTDAVAFHFYTSTPERMVPAIARVRAVMAKHGIGERELWNTESGFMTQNTDEPALTPAGKALDEDTAAAYVMRALVLTAAAGVKRFYWYAWDNGIFGLTHGRGRSAHRAASAYSQARRWLLGASISHCESSDSKQWVCTLRRGERTAWIVWRTEGEGRWQPPVRAFQLETLRARVEKPVGTTVTVGAAPTLITAAGTAWSP